MLTETDRARLARMRGGEEAAFEALFREHYPGLCAFAFGYVESRADAEDVAQSVFLDLWRRRESLEVRSGLKAYLYASARNLALNRSARARLHQRWYEEQEPVAADPSPGPDEILASAELAQRVHAALDRLTPGCRRVLQLRALEQFSRAEVAEVLGISIKAVETQLTRAHHALRAQLRDLLG